VGFEALYWIPWLRKLRRDLDLAPERLMPISRGGAAAWYGTPEGVELYAIREPQAVRVENRLQGLRTGLMKQTAVSPFDAAVLREVNPDALWLHPQWMYHALTPYWAGLKGFDWLAQRVDFQIPLVQFGETNLRLPEHFIAVRFYERSTLPAFPDVTKFAKAAIAKLADQQPVVLLNSGLHLDDHRDFVTTGPNISTLSDYLPVTPQNNLAAQAAVLSKSMGFVGTYGGLAQLALSLGKPSVSFFHEWHGTAIPHRHLAVDLSLRSGVPFLVQRLADLPMLQSVCPPVTTNRTALASVPVTA